jgi:hypothetical protein
VAKAKAGCKHNSYSYHRAAVRDHRAMQRDERAKWRVERCLKCRRYRLVPNDGGEPEGEPADVAA